uniref:Transposase Tc1-like domain-containing protein n=1 Tax=Neolamprologus brichardi TaxID=32507 RepID=A0A3Q4G9G8_NEOBR
STLCLSQRETAKKVKVSVSTVCFTIKRQETGANSDRKRSGRLKATTESEDMFLRVNSLCDRQLTGHQLLAHLNSGLAARKPLLRHQNKTKRFSWAMKHRRWTTEVWYKSLVHHKGSLNGVE